MKRTTKKKQSTRYRSKFEEDVAKILNGRFKYEESKFNYTSNHVYTVDFDDGTVYLECKGRFRFGEARKYLDITRCNPDIRLEFVFYNPNTPMPGAKRRKDGTKHSMAEWATMHGFNYYTLGSLPEAYTRGKS